MTRQIPFSATEMQVIEEFIGLVQEQVTKSEAGGDIQAMEMTVLFRAMLGAIQMELMMKDIKGMYGISDDL